MAKKLIINADQVDEIEKRLEALQNILTRELTKKEMIASIINNPKWDGGDAEYLESKSYDELHDIFDVSQDYLNGDFD